MEVRQCAANVAGRIEDLIPNLMPYEAMKRHELRGCVCTQPGTEGDKARAGQFWNDGRDTRND